MLRGPTSAARFFTNSTVRDVTGRAGNQLNRPSCVLASQISIEREVTVRPASRNTVGFACICSQNRTFWPPGANLEAHDNGSRDTFAGAMKGMTWIPLDWTRGLVRVGVQSAIAHPEAEKLLVRLMTERGLKIPPPPTSSICLTKGVKGCQ